MSIQQEQEKHKHSSLSSEFTKQVKEWEARSASEDCTKIARAGKPRSLNIEVVLPELATPSSNPRKRTQTVEFVDGMEREVKVDKFGNAGQVIPSRQDRRVLQHTLRHMAREILGNDSSFHRQSNNGDYQKPHGVCMCGTSIRKDQNYSYVNYSPSRQKVHLSNLQACNLLWACPTCAAKITEKRATEIDHIIRTMKDMGYSTAFMTLTLPHTSTDELKNVQSNLANIWRKMNQHRTYRDLVKKYGIEHHIRAQEITWKFDRNGWHPHFHILFFFKNPITIIDIPKQRKEEYSKIGLEFFEVWRKIAVSLNWEEPKIQGFDFKEAQNVDDYLNKWATAQEMTKGFAKSNDKKGVFTPFSLLHLYATSFDELERAQCAVLFKEFVRAFKGARQLTFSKDLKKICNVEELEDGEITEAEPDDILIGQLSQYEIKLLNSARSEIKNNMYEKLPQSSLLVELQNNIEIWAKKFLREHDISELEKYLKSEFAKWMKGVRTRDHFQSFSYSEDETNMIDGSHEPKKYLR